MGSLSKALCLFHLLCLTDDDMLNEILEDKI